MAIDTMQKRMSAMNPGCPWRGPLVDAAESGFSSGNRQAANLSYSGVAAGDLVVLVYIGVAGHVFRCGTVGGTGQVVCEPMIGGVFQAGSALGSGEVP